MPPSILLVGCTGLVGQALCRHLVELGYALRVLVRADPPQWLDELDQQYPYVDCLPWAGGDVAIPANYVAGCHAVVNLAGAPVADFRWSDQRKEVLRESRLATTRSVVRAISDCSDVTLLVNASGISVYGFDQPLASEASPTQADHFLAELALDWEKEASVAKALAHCRVLVVRIGIVLSPDGGPLTKMIPPFLPRFIPLVPLASGQQGMPWVHIDDVVGMITSSLRDDRWQGVVNAVAPERHNNKEFTRQAAAHSGHWFVPFGPPAWLLKLLLGEMATMVTGDISVESIKAAEWGYEWRHETLASALRACGYTQASDEK